MPALPNYKAVCVVQKDPRTGCIPAAIEWMLRYKKIEGINLDDFQERFDLLKRGTADNNFSTISQAVTQAYPHVQLKQKIFQTGKDKLAFVDSCLSKGEPCLLSIARNPDNGPWHIVPVVEISKDEVKVLWLDEATIEKQIHTFPRSYLEHIHDKWQGGQDVLVFASSDVS